MHNNEYNLNAALNELRLMNEQLDEVQELIDAGYGKSWIRQPDFRHQLEIAQLDVYEKRALIKAATLKIAESIICPN